MIEEPPLLRIRRTHPRPSAAQIAALTGVASSVVSDALLGGGALEASVRHIDGGHALPCTVTGPALTADCGPGDNLAALAALEQLVPGDVLVAGFGAYLRSAILGDRVVGMMRNCGAAGLVTDGPMRDLPGLVACGLPIWCAGLSPASPFSKGPGTVGHPVQIAGQTVASGDMIVADLDGVVVVPFARLDEVIARVAAILTAETALDAKVAAGLKNFPKLADLLQSDQVHYDD